MLQHFVWTSKLNYRGKASEMSLAWSHVFLNQRHNSFQTNGGLVLADQNGGKFENFQNFQTISFSEKFIGRNIESDEKI